MQQNTKQTNHKMYFLIIAFFGAFIVMCTFLVWFNMSNQSEFFNNSYNSRQELMAEQNIRGTIFSADREKLAYTEVQADGSEKRIYPYNELFCHVIGYSTRGKSGVESLTNYELSHSNITLNDKLNTNVAGEKNPADTTAESE